MKKNSERKSKSKVKREALVEQPKGDDGDDIPREDIPVPNPEELPENEIPMVISDEGSVKNELNYEEIYLENYAETSDKNLQKYAIDRTGGQYYKREFDEENNSEIEVYAKKRKGEHMVNYYAKSAELEEYPAKVKEGDEWVSYGYMKDENEKQIYPFNEKLQKDIYEYYASGDPLLAEDENKKEYYPSFVDPETRERIQYLPKSKNGEYYILEEHNMQIYPMNLTTNRPAYPRDDSGNEFYLTAFGRPYYIDHDGVEIYAKVNEIGADGKEELRKRPIFIDSEKGPIYARDKKLNMQIYPETSNGAQFYAKHGLEEKAALDKDGKQYYAKDEEGNEIYPKKYFA